MSAYEFRYDPITDVVQVIASGRIVEEFTCAYRGKVKAAYIALERLNLTAADVTYTGFEKCRKES